MDALHAGLAFFIALLVVALTLGVVAERARIPYTAVLLLASAPFYFPGLPIQFGPSMLVVFLPALIFEAAWNLDHRALRKTWRTIAILAVPGVILSAAIVGIGLFVMKQLPLPQALLLGVILAATDPVAVIATFRRLNVPVNLTTVVEGESLFNDGTAVVLYGVTVALIRAGTPVHGLFFSSANAVDVTLGGAAIGLAVAFPIARIMRMVFDPLLHIVATLVAAYGSYLVAESFHLSGIFATIATGIGLRIFRTGEHSDVAGKEIEYFWSVLAFLANSLLFLLIGLRIEFPRMLHQPLLACATLALLVLARVVIVYGLMPLVRIPGEGPAWRHVVTLAGMRGALSLALALSLPNALPLRAQIIDAVFFSVFLTLVIQGIVIGPLVARLRLSL